jgi:energy-coupling factor transporter ATP-binding protein EcfA2
MKIVAIAGRKGAGKTSLAKYLSSHIKDTRRCSFAQPIKAALLGCGFPAMYMDDPALKEQTAPGWGTSYRLLAQTLGNGWRSLNPDIFVQRWMEAVKAATLPGNSPDGLVVIVDDLRYANEVEALEALGALIIYLDAGDRLGENTDSDASEAFDWLDTCLCVDWLDANQPAEVVGQQALDAVRSWS